MKQLKEKVSKGKVDESEIKKLEVAHKKEVIDLSKNCSSEVNSHAMSSLLLLLLSSSSSLLSLLLLMMYFCTTLTVLSTVADLEFGKGDC